MLELQSVDLLMDRTLSLSGGMTQTVFNTGSEFVSTGSLAWSCDSACKDAGSQL